MSIVLFKTIFFMLIFQFVFVIIKNNMLKYYNLSGGIVMKKIFSLFLCAAAIFTFTFGAYAKFTFYGDVTCDKKINSSDALSVLMTSVGLKSLDDDGKRAADVDGNGKVNSSDALLILNFSIGMIYEFPAEADVGKPDRGHDVF